MSGVDIIGALLLGSAEARAFAAEGSILSEFLPEDVVLPAFLVRSVSLTDRQPLRRGPMVHSSERIAVTVRARNYDEQRRGMKIVRSICGGFVATHLGDVTNVSVLTDGTGPDVIGPGNTSERTQDFRVSFNADA